jgi:RND family efflux transporter MFP subunit
MTDKRIPAALRPVFRLWRLWGGLAGLVIVVLWAGGACRERVPAGREEREPGDPLPAGAVLLTVSNETVATRIDVVGTVASEERVRLSSRTSAYVKEVLVSAGDRVKANEKLMALDDREIREQLTAAEAQLKRAETEFNRAKQLLKTQATTEQAFDAAESAFSSARAHVDRIKVMLSYAEIRSPIDGVVTDRRIEAGDLANPGQLLLTVYDPANMRLEAAVPVRLIERLSKGQGVEVVLDRPAGTMTGRVAEIVSEVDPSSRTQKVKIRLEGATDGILPGTFGRVWVEQDERLAILLPADSVYRVGQLEFVHSVAGRRVRRRLVKTGPRYGDRVEILSGLRAGDVVVANPAREG